MPIISDTQLARIQNVIASKDRALASVKGNVTSKKKQIIHATEAVGAAGAVSFVRGKLEAADGTWDLPGVPVDIESLIGAGLVVGSFFKLFGTYDDDAGAAGVGILSHYCGQVARKWSKTGNFSHIAGRHHVGGSQELANALDGVV